MTDKQEEQINVWIKSLEPFQLRDALFSCVDQLILADTIRIDEEGKPYWEVNGETLTD